MRRDRERAQQPSGDRYPSGAGTVQRFKIVGTERVQIAEQPRVIYHVDCDCAHWEAIISALGGENIE